MDRVEVGFPARVAALLKGGEKVWRQKPDNKSENGIFYLALFFFLYGKLLFTPDFGESDAYHFNLSLKYYLAQTLKSNRLPFWTDKLQNGYPLLAEGQVGALFLPNIVLLKFLPFASAYNLLLISSLFILSCGVFVLLLELGVTPLIALLLGLIASFNGSLSLRFVHLDLIQSFSLVPLLIYFSLRYVKTKKYRYLPVYSLLITEMILAGHMQIVFIGLLGAGLCIAGFTLTFVQGLKAGIQRLIIFAVFAILGMAIAAPQILPTLELAGSSSRGLGLSYEVAVSLPFRFENLVSYVKPFAFGSQKLGTYPPYNSDWGIFWENTPYLGWVFMISYGVLFILALRKAKKPELSWGFFFLFLFFVLLALGKYSPLYFLFNFAPFNFFRTPAKYLVFANLLLLITFGLFSVCYRRKKLVNTILVALLLATAVDVIIFTFQYHLFLPKNKVLERPPAAVEIGKNSAYFSYGGPAAWNEVFLHRGWNSQKDSDNYLFFKNFLYANSNLIFDRRTVQVNTGAFRERRVEYLDSFLNAHLPSFLKESTKEANLTSLLQLEGIKNIISAEELRPDIFSLVRKLSNGDQHLFVYALKNYRETPIYFPKSLTRITYLSDFDELMRKGKISEVDSVYDGQKLPQTAFVSLPAFRILQDDPERLIFSVSTGQATLAVVKRNYFPEWKVTVDGQSVAPIKVNLVHIGVVVGPGTHTIDIRYKNEAFWKGVALSVVGLSLLAVIGRLKIL
ncbi:hypothetical protein HY214_00345 [Candidatus Roizmanbacteria bacterium]|nr:hypothetical protein [Candidatus Roizmanbacteria bacterium]